MIFATLLHLVLAMALPVGPFAGTVTGRAKSPPCTSGTCTFSFVGPTLQTLPAYNTAFVNISSSQLCGIWVLSNGTGGIEIDPGISPFSSGGCILSSSTAQVVKVTLPSAPDGNSQTICVGMTANVSLGTCAQFGFLSGGNFTSVNIFKNGTFTGLQFNVSAPIAVTHTIGLTVVPGSTVAIQLDGVDLGTKPDPSPAISSGSPGFFGGGTGHLLDNVLSGPFQDHL